jgi:glycerol-3-phosphate acyltransferase PlsY
MLLLYAFAIGYLCGSIPFGLLLTRVAGLGDIRAIGSGNIGATNVLRTGKKGLAALTLLLDGGKGALAVGLALWLLPAQPYVLLLAGIGAFLGHLFPVWLKFKGGKGVATGLGVLLGLSWPVGLAAIGTWLLVALEAQYSSMAALAAFTVTPVIAWALGAQEACIASLVFLPLLYWTHRANIRRLKEGTEAKIVWKKAR